MNEGFYIFCWTFEPAINIKRPQNQSIRCLAGPKGQFNILSSGRLHMLCCVLWPQLPEITYTNLQMFIAIKVLTTVKFTLRYIYFFCDNRVGSLIIMTNITNLQYSTNCIIDFQYLTNKLFIFNNQQRYIDKF